MYQFYQALHTIVSVLVIPIAKHSVSLDGQPETVEWNDSYQANFSSSREQGNVIVYLKYELFNKTLDEAFIIPVSSV
ncbi:MAG: hypothetical protein JO297_08685 [Nitrososphaeraceae archaeon]|nr:hypothetical protein [Nitrososphaeraceae archaeon]